MDFSIFNVPIQIKKYFFTTENLKVSLAIWWASFWRGVVAGLVFGIAVGVLYLVGMYLELGVAVGMIAIIPTFAALIYMMTRIHYYVLFEKEYKSVSRELTGDVFIFKSWAFWKRILITFLIPWVVSIIINIFLELIFTQAQMFVIGVFMSFFWWSVFLHGGTWGFVPKPKTNNT